MIGKLASVVAPLLVSSLLIATGLLHLANPYVLLRTILTYEIVPLGPATYAAAWLPFVHLGLGSALLSAPTLRKATFVATTLLFLVYVAAQASVIVRGLDIPCGCFGAVTKDETVGFRSIGVALVGLSLSLTGSLRAARSVRSE